MRARPPRLPPRLLAARLGAPALAVFLATAAAVLAWGREGPTHLDALWMSGMLEIRSPAATAIARALDVVGGTRVSIVLIALAVVALLLLRRPWAALCLAAASIASMSVVQLLKHAIDRPRPEDMLVTSDIGSFPSGHSANAALIATVAATLLARRWVVVVGVLHVAAMTLSRTYLGAHWITDTIGGAASGCAVAALAWGLLGRRVLDEEERRRRGTPPGT